MDGLRIISIILAVTLLHFFAAANDNVDRLILKYANGESVEILLSEMPVITFDNDKLQLTTSATTLQCSLDDLQDYSFEGASMGQHDIEMPNFTLRQEGDELIISSKDSILEVKVYDIQGIQMNVEVINTGDSCVVNISSLAPGVYILSFNGNSIKIVKK